MGWIGMLAGAGLGGYGIYRALRDGSGGGSGDAAGAALVLGSILGAVVGGILLSLPARGLEALYHWIFG